MHEKLHITDLILTKGKLFTFFIIFVHQCFRWQQWGEDNINSMEKNPLNTLLKLIDSAICTYIFSQIVFYLEMKPTIDSTLACHYSDVIMSAMSSQITCASIVCLNVCSANQRKHQNSASLAFVRGIHRWPMISPTKGQIVSIWWRHHATRDATKQCYKRDIKFLYPNCMAYINSFGVFQWKIPNIFRRFTYWALSVHLPHHCGHH